MSQFETAMDIGKRVIEVSKKIGGPMTEQQGGGAIMLLLTLKKDPNPDFSKFIADSPAHRMAFGRLEAAGIKDKVTQTAVLWLTDLANGVPGNISLMVAVIAAVIQDPNAPKPVTLEYFMQRVFPFDVPNEKVFDAVWIEQKMGGGNLIDQLPHC